MTMESLEELRNRLLREERVQLMVRTRAYEIYQMRGGQPGWEAQDWFQAETEGREELDLFIDAMKSIAEEAAEDPELLRHAPLTTKVGRLDEVAAARKPVLRWRPEHGDKRAEGTSSSS